MGGILLGTVPWIVPQEGPPLTDRAVAANFERFNGLEALDNAPGSTPLGAAYGPTPRPGQRNQPAGQTYTPGAIPGLTNTLGGQPLPVAPWEYTINDRGYTPAKWSQAIQSRLGTPGVGRQASQVNTGVAQTVFFADLQNNPPQPDSLDQILFSYG